MKTNFKITIPEPCNKGWKNMVPKENGRFCDSCDKVVVDFTSMTDAEIVKLIEEKEKKQIKTCGHFKKTQINRPLLNSVPYKSRPSGFMITAVLLVGLTALSCKAQGESVITNNNIEVLQGDTIMSQPVSNEIQTLKIISNFPFKSIAGAEIRISNKGYEKIIYKSDKEGMVEIKRLNDLMTLNLVITHPLYDEKKMAFTFGHNSSFGVNLNESILIDGMMVEGEIEYVPEEKSE
jgi:hypothetical protein